jgi:hypothetical protein
MKCINKRRGWRFFYAVCCLVYMGWVSYLGSNDFGRVQREYRRAGDQLEPGRLHAAALEELLAECRMRSEKQPADVDGAVNELQSGDCLSWPPAVVEAREAKIRERLVERQNRAGRKLLLFSLFFGVIFLIIPPVLIYVFVVVIAKFFRSVKIVRE